MSCEVPITRRHSREPLGHASWSPCSDRSYPFFLADWPPFSVRWHGPLIVVDPGHGARRSSLTPWAFLEVSGRYRSAFIKRGSRHSSTRSSSRFFLPERRDASTSQALIRGIHDPEANVRFGESASSAGLIDDSIRWIRRPLRSAIRSRCGTPSIVRCTAHAPAIR